MFGVVFSLALPRDNFAQNLVTSAGGPVDQQAGVHSCLFFWSCATSLAKEDYITDDQLTKGHVSQSATRDYAPHYPYCHCCTPLWTAICVWIRPFACSYGFTLVWHCPLSLHIVRRFYSRLRLRRIYMPPDEPTRSLTTRISPPSTGSSSSTFCFLPFCLSLRLDVSSRPVRHSFDINLRFDSVQLSLFFAHLNFLFAFLKMARFTAFAALLAVSASALPLHKRIAQTTIDAVKPWEAACNQAGGGAQCNNIAVTAAGTLLAAPPACAQQDSADAMITLAKSLDNDAEMIRLAQIFRQQPRNSPDSLASLYCQTAPKNKELEGLFQCQFAGVKQDTFTGNIKAGAAGTIPLGGNAPNPAGSCPANPDGPVDDGQQLNKLVQSPGSGNTGNNGGGNGNDSNADPESGNGNGDGSSTVTVTRTQITTITVTEGSPAPTGGTSITDAFTPVVTADAAKPFLLQNGKDAQELNRSFETLTASSSCNDGEQACVEGGFAQCVGGSFQITSCSGGLQCFALPLVNKAGTSITCDTEADAAARIAATGATGGVRG
ncbi:proline-rich protein [Rhizoctonia solani AG-1 IA]|uniref:Proline-rich protein n=1 Tax=Thanatephorus cucumeris (strain AG1-IA) TaxID=983506 RepID=L8WEK4_THACA|nr:proline-rich protein [Rhizoctonia solani AG-1 IA]